MSTQREIWADAAKGFCIVAVVLVHAAGLAPETHPILQTFIYGLSPLRVPLFFLISGFFAARAVNRPWKLVARPRIGRNVYIYAVWLAVAVALYTWLLPAPEGRASYTFETYATNFWYPTNHLWYIYALAAYFVIAKSVRNLPVSAWLIPALFLSAISWFIDDFVPTNVARNLVFFLVGALAPQLVRWIVRSATWTRFCVGSILFAVLALGVRLASLGEFPGVSIVLAAAAIYSGITGFVKISESAPVMVQPFAWVGRKTLEIYVMHVPLIMFMLFVVDDAVASIPWYQLLMTGVCVVIPVFIKRILVQVPAGKYLFDLPGRRVEHNSPAKVAV